MLRLGRGVPYKAIAAELGISDSSVATYRQRAFAKLGVTHIVAAILRLRGRRRSSGKPDAGAPS